MRKFRLLSFLCAPRFKVTAVYQHKDLTMGLFAQVKKRGRYVVTAVRGRDTLMRRVSLPENLTGATLRGALRFKAEEELPYTAEEAAFAVPGSPRGLFFSTKRAFLPEEPYDAVIPAPLALLHFTSYFTLPESCLVVYADEDEILFLALEKGEALQYTSLPKREGYEKEIERRLQAYGWGPDTPYLQLGDLDLPLKLGEQILLEPTWGMSQEELKEKALLIGLCQLVLDKPLTSFDLREKNASYRKIPLIKPFILSALSFCLLWLAGEDWYTGREEALQVRLKTEDVRSYIKTMQQQTAKLSYPYPLKPMTPLFSDFLAWLNAQAPEGVQIEKIHYHLASLPSLKNPQEHYVVLVDLVFLAGSAEAARLFHDRLIAPNPFVVAGENFVWQSSEKDYRTSFKLKDRTIYELS